MMLEDTLVELDKDGSKNIKIFLENSDKGLELIRPTRVWGLYQPQEN